MKGKREIGLLVVLILLVLICSVVRPIFLDPRNINSILLWMPLLLVAAVGQFPVIVARGIDISVGSILGLSAISVGLISKSNPHIAMPLLFVAGALIGLVLGSLNGIIIAFGRVPAVVATIGTLTAFRGLTFVVSKGDQVDSTSVPQSLTSLANHGIDLGSVTISWLLLLGLTLAVIAYFASQYLQFYRNIFAYGSNPEAAYLRGISPKSVQMVCYCASGTLAGVAGTMYPSCV